MAEYTIDLCEGGVVTASRFENFRPPVNAFDNVIPTEYGYASCWECNGGNSSQGAWIQYDFTTPQKITKVVLHKTAEVSEVNYMPAAFQVMGSVDGIIQHVEIANFTTTLDDWRTEGDHKPYKALSFEFLNEVNYKSIRINCTVSLYGAPYFVLNEIEMMKTIEVESNSDRPDKMTELFNISSVKGNLRGKASEGFIRPTIKQFFTSADFEEIESYTFPGFDTMAIMTNGVSGAVISDAGRRVTYSSSEDGAANSDISVTSEKYYFEIHVQALDMTHLGIASGPAYEVLNKYGVIPFYCSIHASIADSVQVRKFDSGDIVGFAVDLIDFTVDYYINNVWLERDIFTKGTNDVVYVGVRDSHTAGGVTSTLNIHLKPEDMTYDPPEGFPKGFGSTL